VHCTSQINVLSSQQSTVLIIIIITIIIIVTDDALYVLPISSDVLVVIIWMYIITWYSCRQFVRSCLITKQSKSTLTPSAASATHGKPTNLLRCGSLIDDRDPKEFCKFPLGLATRSRPRPCDRPHSRPPTAQAAPVWSERCPAFCYLGQTPFDSRANRPTHMCR